MNELEYNPLKWPPDINLAQLHYDCCKPGIDNPEGRRCPCCQRNQKLSNSKWPLRNITKDFRRFGGGVPGYFYLLVYLMVMFAILIAVKVVYQILILEQVCPTLDGTPERCALLFGVFWNCDNKILYNALVNQGNQGQANTLQYLQLANYLILVIATLGIKVFLHLLTQNSDLDQKLFSHFALIIKGVPLYYQLEDLKAELKAIVPTLSIAEMFYLHKTCEYELSLRGLVDLHFAMKHAQAAQSENNRYGQGEKAEAEYRKMKEKYLKMFDKYEKQSSNLKASSKKVIIVFNSMEEKEAVHKKLRMSEVVKFWYYLTKLLGCKSESIGYYSERTAEPQQIYWKYIGESSTQKQKVRIQTTIIGVGLVVLAFVVFYFPMLQIDKEKIFDPTIGTVLGMVISVVILMMVIIFRGIIAGLMPLRRPSSKLAEGYFVVITVAMFFLFFYLVSPAVFYLITPSIPNNFKLATFFMVVMLFCLSNIILAILDLAYRGHNSKRKKLLSQNNEASRFCQGRLHQQVTPMPFPLSFKLVVAFNMWSFNSYYSFNIPYLQIFFLGTLMILYCVDKYLLYNHYKTSQYLSLELQHQVQKVVLVFLLICVSLGYLTIALFAWEQILILVVFVFAIILNFTLQYFFKQQKEEVRKHNTDLRLTLEKHVSNARAATMLNMLQNQIKTSFVFNDPKGIMNDLSEASLASAIVMYGYKETYELYLKQFQRKEVHQLIQNRYFDIKRTYSARTQKKRQSQLAQLQPNSLQQKLIDTANNLTKEIPASQPPPIGEEININQQKPASDRMEVVAEHKGGVYEPVGNPGEVQNQELPGQNGSGKGSEGED